MVLYGEEGGRLCISKWHFFITAAGQRRSERASDATEKDAVTAS
jgi:hypothetical protein